MPDFPSFRKYKAESRKFSPNTARPRNSILPTGDINPADKAKRPPYRITLFLTCQLFPYYELCNVLPLPARYMQARRRGHLCERDHSCSSLLDEAATGIYLLNIKQGSKFRGFNLLADCSGSPKQLSDNQQLKKNIDEKCAWWEWPHVSHNTED